MRCAEVESEDCNVANSFAALVAMAVKPTKRPGSFWSEAFARLNASFSHIVRACKQRARARRLLLLLSTHSAQVAVLLAAIFATLLLKRLSVLRAERLQLLPEVCMSPDASATSRLDSLTPPPPPPPPPPSSLPPPVSMGSAAAVFDLDGWSVCSARCGPGIQTRTLNDCGDAERRPCEGTGVLGCDGVCDSGKQRDCAAVCGGSLVPDCLGQCGGYAVRDSCGVCGGRERDLGCDGVCFSGLAPDCAGMCGGAAVPDSCGICGGLDRDVGCDGRCGSGLAVDCQGVCGGAAERDDCGVCLGMNQDKGCDGQCFSGSMKDCLGVCGGQKVVDDCGVCGGLNKDRGCVSLSTQNILN